MTVLKFKIPNKLSAIDQAKRVCLECDKEFTSGKALGGHMRIHHKNPKPSKTNNNPYYMNCVNHEGKPTCSQCGKTFLTMKSLFGHMRCHPERLWRGILPPSAAVVRRRDETVDLMKYLRRWPVTERRGRKSLKPADDVVLLEAVEDLLSLANAGDSVTEDSPSVKGKSVTVEEIDSQQKIKRRKKMKLMMDIEDNGAVTVPLAKELAVSDIQCKYKCTTCNKGFATHQALGGHRSSHNKYKLTSTDNIHNQIQELEVHQCKVCDKVFATGQALGGHKRCHWGGVTVSEGAQALSSQITSAESVRKVLDFDLNEMPPMMEEDDDQYASVSGNGYAASSSYNSS
ncbi:uncharacterized protein LOC143558129 [Bidens hawaiensis]|uniref:uncharacterized protein LOC143558129 n=1 Tax=Bidens hawaiensis TaxID=980011 RepID=UPI00404A0CBC